MDTLSKKEFMFAVTSESPVDGATVVLGYFSDRALADKFAGESNRLRTNVVQTTLWQGNDGCFYELPYIREVLMDAPSRKEVLKKLTPIERKVLGL